MRDRAVDSMLTRANMLLKQWENEVAWFDPPAGGSTPHSTLSEAAVPRPTSVGRDAGPKGLGTGAAERVSNAYW